MTARFRQGRRQIAMVVAWGWAAGIAAAQAPNQGSMPTTSLAAVKASVPVGDVVYVTDTTGATIKGRLAEVTDESVRVRGRTDVRLVSADVRRIQWQQPDSPLTGVLIGAGVGAIPGIYWLIADPNECTGMCPEEYAAIGISAIVGGLIDHAIKKKLTVYDAGTSAERARTFLIGPLLTRSRKGVQVAVKF